jgi:ElaA protein
MRPSRTATLWSSVPVLGGYGHRLRGRGPPAGTVRLVDELILRAARGPEISTADLYAALCLRAEVFVVEQECAYLDPDGRDLDAGTTHLWLAAEDGTIAAYVRLLTEPAGGHRIGRVVTAPAHRGAHLAGRLIDRALGLAERPVVLDAQSHLVHVYARHGFQPSGPEFLDDGIRHTPMRLG